MYLYALKYFDRFIDWGEGGGAERKYCELEVNTVPLPKV